MHEVLSDIEAERRAQDAKWGEQNHPDGTNEAYKKEADEAKKNCAELVELGLLCWIDILIEEVAEACAEADPVKLRAELIQVAAVAANWAQAIDRRSK